MKELIALLLLPLLLMLQTAVVARTPLLSGYADLILVTLAAWALQRESRSAWHWAIFSGVLVGWFSGLPWVVPLFSYLLVVALARLLVHRIWQAPLLAMFAVVLVGSLSMYLFSIGVLILFGTPLDWRAALSAVVLPSLFLNLLLAIPAYPIMRDLARWVYDIEAEV